MEKIIARIKETFAGIEMSRQLKVRLRNSSTVDLIVKRVDESDIIFNAIPKSSLESIGLSMIGDTAFFKKHNINHTVNVPITTIN